MTSGSEFYKTASNARNHFDLFLLKVLFKYLQNGWVCLLFSDEGKSKCFSQKIRCIEMREFQWKETKIVINLNETCLMCSKN